MEKCPKCGNWTFAINVNRRVLVCRRISCKYELPVNVDKYLEKNDVLPKLVESLKLNGKTKTMPTH